MPPDISSLYPQYQPPPNPLATAATALDLRQKLNQNQLFQQEFGARQAIGQAYQQAVNPLTGELDTNKLLSTVANDPRAAFMAGDVAQQALARRQAQLGIDTAAQELAVRRQAAANQVLGSVLSIRDKSGNFAGTRADTLRAIAEGHASGMMDPSQTARFTSEIANLPDEQLQQYLIEHNVQGVSPAERLSQTMPTPDLVNVGGSLLPVARSGVVGVQPGQPSISLGLTPEQLAAPQTWTDASGVVHQGTRQQYLQAVGQNTSPGSISGTTIPGRYPSAAGPIAGPVPGSVQAQETTAQASAVQGASLQRLADEVPNRKAVLNNMLGALNNFTPGPGSESVRTVAAFAQKFGIPFSDKVATPTAAQEEFSKFAKQLAIQQSGALGAGTNEKLETSIGASPSVDLSKLGNQRIIHILQGNEDAIAAKNRAWQAYQAQNGPQSYGKFSAQFNQEFDPRIWQMSYMSPAEKKELVSSIKDPAERQHFAAAKQLAIELGLGR